MRHKCLFALAVIAVVFIFRGSAPGADSFERAVVFRVSPVYPVLAEKMRVEGTVLLEAEVGPDGKVLSVHMQAGHPLLAAAAEQAVMKWHFNTGYGISKSQLVHVTIEFKLAH